MKRILKLVLSIAILISLMAGCSSQPVGKIIQENETANSDYLKSAVSAMNNYTFCMNNSLDFGMSYEDIKKELKGPFQSDTGTYISEAFMAKLPSSANWKNDDGTINADNFIDWDIMSYYICDSSVGLYECGFLAPDPNLWQYDFLKEYYTMKFGEPDKEEWEWNSKSAQPDENTDYYQAFVGGHVRVMTVWDIKELDMVLVIDWLNDPANQDNNYGQISFYMRNEDFSLDSDKGSDTDDKAED